MKKDAINRQKLAYQKRTQKICQICCEKVSRNKHLKIHLNKHTRAGYKCHVYQRPFKRIDFYTKHQCLPSNFAEGQVVPSDNSFWF